MSEDTFAEVPGVFRQARHVEVICLECIEREEVDSTVSEDVVHPKPEEIGNLDLSTFRIRCPRCSKFYGRDCFITLQILTGPQLDLVDGLAAEPDEADEADEEQPEA